MRSITVSKNRAFLALLLAGVAYGSESIDMGEVSVTATKVAKATKEVSESIAVVDEQTIKDKNILNIQEAIENIPGVIAASSTNSPSPRLIIRGAGLKARYGVREIMVIKDGVPMTDPDSFTRFDFIDMQDVSSVEVQKGPGSINASNATGGVIQLITKSVFDEDKNRLKIGLGDDNQRNGNLKVRGQLSDFDFVSFTASKRQIDNSWRDNNEFDTTQISLKYGHIFDDAGVFESELSYTKSNLNLPSSMTKEEFEEFKQTGKQHNTSSTWQNTARDSEIISLNAKYEKEMGDFTFKPRVYANKWKHFHPVTGIINQSDDNLVAGTDLEFNMKHQVFGLKSLLVGGLTFKMDRTNDSKKYLYKDVETKTTTSGWPPQSTVQITRTLSNEKGDLASIEDSSTNLYGVYFMESVEVTDKLGVDGSIRVDRLDFDINGNEMQYYDYSSSSYKNGIGLYDIAKAFTLVSAKLGMTYAVSDSVNVYCSLASANQAPTTSELSDNNTLAKSTSINYEVGMKARAKKFSYDFAAYENRVKDEIIQIKDANGNSLYDNAGETKKRGLEFNIGYDITDEFGVGGAWGYNDFKFVKYNESVRGSLVSRDGNYLPSIPRHQYSLYATYHGSNGLKGRITTKSFGSYYMDSANTQKYEGFDLVTDLMIGYEQGNHSLQLNVNNIFDDYYAIEASKDVYANESYKAASPRNMMLTYAYQF